MSDASNHNLTLLQRLSEPLQSIASILGKLVQKEHPTMSQADLTRPRRATTAKQRSGRDRMMRSSKRRRVNERSLW